MVAERRSHLEVGRIDTQSDWVNLLKDWDLQNTLASWMGKKWDVCQLMYLFDVETAWPWNMPVGKFTPVCQFRPTNTSDQSPCDPSLWSDSFHSVLWTHQILTSFLLCYHHWPTSLSERGRSGLKLQWTWSFWKQSTGRGFETTNLHSWPSHHEVTNTDQ